MKATIDIDIIDETNELKDTDRELMDSVIRKAFEMEKIDKNSEVCITVVHNEQIQEINREYRNKDMPTDVISFALTEMSEDELEIIYDEEIPTVLGDIIISIDKTKEQAEEYNHSFARELAFLTVHGFLHLLGYDHMTEDEEKVMFTKQEEILRANGMER